MGLAYSMHEEGENLFQKVAKRKWIKLMLGEEVVEK